MSKHLHYWSSDDPGVLDCADLDCVDIGVGIMHHPMCGVMWEPEDLYGPDSPEDEETFPPDPHPDMNSDPR